MVRGPQIPAIAAAVMVADNTNSASGHPGGSPREAADDGGQRTRFAGDERRVSLAAVQDAIASNWTTSEAQLR